MEQLPFDVTYCTDDFHSPYKERRDCIKQINEYIYADQVHTVCAIYGLRRTGKTELMKQCMEDMPLALKQKTQYIMCHSHTSLAQLKQYIIDETKKGFKYFFVDEITYCNDFQAIGEALANVCVNMYGARMIVTGTESLGLSLPSHSLQYDRTHFVHTTYMSYPEYARILGKGLDAYLMRGSVLVPDVYSNYTKTHKYINTSITDNLIHSLEKSEGLQRYPAALTELYENEELKNMIERIINRFSQDLTVKVIRREFQSHIIGTSLNNIEAHSDTSTRLVLNEAQANAIIRKALGILKNDEMTVQIKQEHKEAVYEFLKEMDVLSSLPVYKSYRGEEGNRLEMITHPAICYNHVQYALQALQDSSVWLEGATNKQKDELIQNAYETACGFIMENVILSDMYHMLCKGNEVELKDVGTTSGRYYVSKLGHTINNRYHEVDMIIFDKQEQETYLFEIKHSDKCIREQSTHLESQEFKDYIEEAFGPIVCSCVLYNGNTSLELETPRISASDFLIEVYKECENEGFSLKESMNKLCGESQENLLDKCQYY